jgi:uncharacterized membrane protein
MTDVSLPAGRFTESDFRVGHVFSQTWEVFSRNFLRFSVITGIASLPPLLIPQTAPNPANPFANLGWVLVALFLMIVLGTLSQAIVLYGAFQAMRGRPVRLADCLRVGLNRFFPIIGLAITVGVGVMLGSMLLLVPGLMLYMMWFVATPVCVVEQLGPFGSLGRSRALTKGHRWKLFGLMLLILLPAVIVGAVLVGVMAVLVGTGGIIGLPAALATPLGQIINLIWSAAWGAFFAVLIVVTYHDLRVVKEGIDTEQIAAVFE